MPDPNQPENNPTSSQDSADSFRRVRRADNAFEQIIEEGLRDKSEEVRQGVEEIIDRWATVFHEPPKRDGPPPGFVKCPTCGEFNGETLWENLTWLGPDEEARPGEIIRVRCLCNGTLCQRCKKNTVHASGSSSYEESTNRIGHWPWFSGLAPCRECREKEKRKESMTDVTGDFNRVVMEHTVESLEEFERKLQETMASPFYRERMAGYTELWITGSREVLRIL